ncbi:phage replication protein O [Azotobacter beijerinckii]|uniref:Phage replication protein O n=1 Tax=Azotobacter beijerinckii TaxID=170623 RepID=A0A1H6ZLL3_9GAMM|nr:replication protein [Azotobacter beijerinckii]SEJ53034.1 phage replication protein O [Azotobacter beijerinckii]
MTNIVTLRNTGGFTRMDNSLMEALATVDLPAREFRILMAIARHTIGYQLESKRLSADEIGKLTNMRRDVVSKAISHLLERRVIFRVGGSRGEIGISPVAEWAFFEGKKHCLSETKSSHSAQIVSLRNDASETETATSLLYSKKEPLVTLPSEEVTAPPATDVAVEAEPAPLVSFDGEDFQVDASLITRWTKKFPGLAVEAELETAASWAADNPRKAKKDWQRFLSSWMRRAAGKVVAEGSCPVDKIIDLYHRTCPNLAPVSVTTDRNLRARIVERWNESEAQQNSGFWKSFFLKANLRNEVYYGGERVKPRLEALVSRSVFRAIVEAEQ